ncbi:MAG: hypothetical protein ACRC8P_01820 [Spiroplasma sp.]
MKKGKNKRFIALLTSMTLVSGPVLLVTACNHEITRYPADLSNDIQNRILFDFVGVNYNVNAKSQFSASFKQGMGFIKKEIEGIMAKEEFINFFIKKLNYSEKKALVTFDKIKDTLGLNILADDYFNTINSGQSFDSKVYASKLIFQTENWHLLGTTRFNYNNSKFYGEEINNPDKIFTPSYLYSDLDDNEKDNKIQEVAKYADEHYNDEIGELTKGNPTWESPNTPEQLPPTLGKSQNAIQEYQKKLERFKWWLRFRYQQYYYANILPQLNETLFTMSHILDSILRITNVNGQIKVQIDNGTYAQQLQKWEINHEWESNYRFVWDYTISQAAAGEINRNWNKNPLPDLMNENGTNLNPDFLNQLAASDKSLKNTVDPILGINAFVNEPSNKKYSKSISKTSSGWADNDDGTHYWGENKQGTFAYSAPIYWIDVILNLNLNYYNNSNNSIVVDANEDYKGLISSWNNTENSPISNSNFSKYIRGNQTDTANNNYHQEIKWNLLWQLLYSIASQADTNPNKETAKNNFTATAKVLFPKYIKKEKIYNIDFWNAVSSYY